jgi:CHAT domain-containing protein/tetratricopeptide (TPR) repeat protein
VIGVEQEALDALRAAAAHVDRHELREAERLLRPYVDREGLTPETQARILLEWSWLLSTRSQRAQAEAGYRRVVELAAAEHLWELRCEALLEAGILARLDGQLAAADKLLVDAVDLAARHQAWLRAGQALAQRAAVAHLRYQFLPARERLAELTEMLRRCPPSDRTEQLRADLCHQSAVSARITRDFDRARQLLGEARDRYAGLGRQVGVANIERELGAVLEQVGDLDEARAAYRRAFVRYLRARRPLGAAHVARRLGQIRSLDVPDDPDAAGYARRRLAQALRLGGDEPGNRLLCELFLARVDRLTGDLDAAQQRLSSLSYDARSTAPRDLSQAAVEWAMLARDRGDTAEAIRCLEQALQPLDAELDPSPASVVHYQLAYQLILDERVEEARDHAVEAFILAEQAGRRLADPGDREAFYRDQRQAYILAMHCTARAGDGAAAFMVATSARAEAMSAFVRSGARLSDELCELIDAVTLAAGTPQLPQMYRRLERATSAQLRQATLPEPAGPAETLAALPPGGHALIVDVLADETTICNRVWLAPDGTPRVDEVQLSDELRAWLDRYHAAESEVAAVVQDAELDALGAAIIPPGLAEALAAGTVPPLIISTGGLLGPVPVAAVRVGGRYLAELARIAVVPAINLWTAIRTRAPRPGTGVHAYLDPDLPGTDRERHLLAIAFPQARFLNREQIRQALTDAGELGLLVLSVHGNTAAGLGQALLLAPDDLLTAAQLLTSRLPDGVLMPACWAGRVELRAAVEPLGLPTAALLAGARWVLAGTVDVSGTTTASLLGSFYRELAEGRAPVDALRETQLSYLRRRGTVPPSLWAGLTIVGDGFRA